MVRLYPETSQKLGRVYKIQARQAFPSGMLSQQFFAYLLKINGFLRQSC